jgi:hypothetical protein
MKRGAVFLPFRILPAVTVALVLCSCVSEAPREIPVEIPDLGNVIEQKPAIATDLSDAVTAVPFLDGYKPAGTSPMSLLPRTKDGGFELTDSGCFAMEVKSYCLAHAKCSPGSDHGAMYAPLRGPRADIVHNVLCRAGQHPEISQGDIQSLLWAITSRTRIKDLAPEIRQAADTLLTRSEIRRLNGGALGLIPDEVMDEAMARLPEEAQRALETEAQLRQMLSSAESTYEEIERAAVVTERPSDEQTVPRGRWSLHPDGMFVRYCPHGFSRTLITLYVPERFRIERDDKGRITSLADGRGNVIVTEYDDTIEPMTVPGEPGLRAYAFRSVRFVSLDVTKASKKFCPLVTSLADMLVVSEWNGQGWVFCGVPTGRGRPAAGSGRFAGLKERYEWSKTHTEELGDLVEGLRTLRGRGARVSISDKGMAEIMSLAQYAAALEQVIGAKPANADRWLESPVGVVKRAWQSAVCTQLAPSASRRAYLGQQQALARALEALGGRGGTLAGSTRAPCACTAPLAEALLAAAALGQTGGAGGHGSFNPGGGSHASGNADQPVGDSNDPSDLDTSCANAYKKEKDEAFDRYLKCTANCLMMESFDESWTCHLNCTANYEAEKELARRRAQECLEK